jgi:hypothetical protein
MKAASMKTKVTRFSGIAGENIMKNKPLKKNWDDVKMVITTVAIASTLGFWNVFSRLEPKVAASIPEIVDPPRPTATQTVQNPTPVQPANSGIIYFQPDQSGLTPVATPKAVQKSAREPSSNVQNRPARPAPVTNTRSSR